MSQMKKQLLNKICDPATWEAVGLAGAEASADSPAADGVLVSASGRRYPVVRGIPRFVFTQDQDQIQTSVSFGFKWKKRDTYDSPASKAQACQWYLTKYGFGRLEEWVTFLETHEAVLDGRVRQRLLLVSLSRLALVDRQDSLGGR